jgi:hypothetical protein
MMTNVYSLRVPAVIPHRRSNTRILYRYHCWLARLILDPQLITIISTMDDITKIPRKRLIPVIPSFTVSNNNRLLDVHGRSDSAEIL